MVNTLDIALDEQFDRRGYGGGGRGGRSGWNMVRGRSGMFQERANVMRRGGPLRANVRPSPFKIAKSFSRARGMIWQNDLFNDSMEAAGLSSTQAGTKLYISNLDFKVSNDDIKDLFSEIGELKRSTVHYDRNGRPSGSAEVIFARRSDALSAFKKYNNVQLDGKAMKIEIIGENNGLPVTARVNVVGISQGAERRTVSMMPKLGRASGSQFNHFPRANRGQGGPVAGRGGSKAAYGSRGGFAPHGSRGFQSGRGRGGQKNSRGGGQKNSRGGGGQKKSRGGGRGKKSADKSAAQLDKELESYHAEAMNTS